ncbi:MAG: hemagglutinin repeat-containing protein [Verrucomicrobiales bacterium]|jgi:hypothetical protein|nr:hemagglutinin repeat-containing protein [Verrucomicrobiales bacterium]
MKPIFDLQLKGRTQVNAEGDITLVAGHDLLIEAAKDTRSHDSRTTDANASYGQTDTKRRWSDNVSNITGKDRVAIMRHTLNQIPAARVALLMLQLRKS